MFNGSMRVFLLFMMILSLSFAGCAMLEKIAPAEVNELGNPIPGTHELTPIASTVSQNLGPYGAAAATGVVWLLNFIELAKVKRREQETNNAFLATVRAIDQARTDPNLKEQWDKLKAYLKNAHSSAGSGGVVSQFLSKL
jgi:hypothetical protein